MSKAKAAVGGTHKLVGDLAGLVSESESGGTLALSLIHMQSLVILLRNPAVRSAGNEREWLKEILAAYGEGCELQVVVISRIIVTNT